MAELSAELERTFVRLWTHCDDEGRCEDRPRLIKAGIYPEHDEMTWQRIDAELWDLRDAGLIERYTVEGVGYIAVTSWDEYQHPQRARESKFPPPPEPSSTPPRPVREPSTNGASDSDEHSATRMCLELGEGEGEGGGVGAVSDSTPSRALVLVPPNGSSPPAKHNGYSADFETWWKAYPRKVAKLDASKAWAKAIKLVTPEQLTEALEACKRSWQAKRRTSEFIPHAATWLNGQRWEDDVSDNGSANEPRGFAGIRDALARMGAS